MSVSLGYSGGMRKIADVDGLIRMLNISTTIERRDIIYALGELKSKKAVLPLIEILEDEIIIVRSSAAWALGEIADARATLPLIGLLNDESDNVRVQAAWALGRIGDIRAVPALKSIPNNASPELRKTVNESIYKIKLIDDDMQKEGRDAETQISKLVDIPLVTIDVPSKIFECKYISRVENKPANAHGNDPGFQNDMVIDDTNDDYNYAGNKKRRITLGLKNDFNGLASVDILFNYIDKKNGDRKSSVWMQLETNGHDYVITEPGINYGMPVASVPEKRWYKDEQVVESKREQALDEMHLPRHKSRESVQYEHAHVGIPDYDPIIAHHTSIGTINEEIPAQNTGEIAGVESNMCSSVNEDDVIRKRTFEREYNSTQTHEIIAEKNTSPILPTDEATNIDMAVPLTQDITSADSVLQNTGTVDNTETMQVTIPQNEKDINVDSAINLLNNIGNSGMANAASTVTDLAGQEKSLQSQLRILPIDEIQNEIGSQGEEVVLIDVGLHGNDPSANISGRLMFYLSRDVALQISNELLGIPPEATVNEFTDDIISTVKESANIFGGQYVSAISEFIEIPITLDAPIFKTGHSSEIAASNKKDVSGKVEFALATDMDFGENKSGLLIILLDPASFDTIISKIF